MSIVSLKNNSLWFQVERDIADLLIAKITNQEITPERATQIAQFVVKSIPAEISDHQMLQILPMLDDEFVELSSVVLSHLKKCQDDNEAQVQFTAEAMIKDGKFQEASNLMQEYFQKKI